MQKQTTQITWVKFDMNRPATFPLKVGKYLVTWKGKLSRNEIETELMIFAGSQFYLGNKVITRDIIAWAAMPDPANL